MYLKSLKLVNFRNYEKLKIDFHKKKTVILGDNAQGKTNLIEAIYFIATLSSQRASTDAEFVRWGVPYSIVNGLVDIGDGSTSELEVVITPGQAKLLKLNGVKKKSFNEYLGRLIAVSFSVDDLLLVRGSPKDRRKWIDTCICQLYPAYYDKLQTYNKIRQQKQALLKTFYGRFQNLSSLQLSMLDSWNEQLTTSGSNLVYLRIRFLKELYPFAQHKCMQISSKQDSLSIEYDSTVGLKIYCHKDPLMAVDDIKRKYSQQIKQKTEEEIEKAQVLVGPHRDDIVFCLNEKEARAFASQGQQRTIVLSLKLSELELMKQSLEEEPLLLLDDVLAELDLSRQKYLFETITNGYQTIITTTDLDSFETAWLEEVDIIKIENGCVVNGKT